MVRTLALSLVAILALAGGVGPARAADFTFTTIAPPGSTFTVAFGINKAGQIVDHFRGVDGVLHGFLKDVATFMTIDFPGNVGRTSATGIDEAGRIVGGYTDASGSQHGFLKDGTTFTTFPATQRWLRRESTTPARSWESSSPGRTAPPIIRYRLSAAEIGAQ